MGIHSDPNNLRLVEVKETMKDKASEAEMVATDIITKVLDNLPKVLKTNPEEVGELSQLQLTREKVALANVKLYKKYLIDEMLSELRPCKQCNQTIPRRDHLVHQDRCIEGHKPQVKSCEYCKQSDLRQCTFSHHSECVARERVKCTCGEQLVLSDYIKHFKNCEKAEVVEVPVTSGGSKLQGSVECDGCHSSLAINKVRDHSKVCQTKPLFGVRRLFTFNCWGCNDEVLYPDMRNHILKCKELLLSLETGKQRPEDIGKELLPFNYLSMKSVTCDKESGSVLVLRCMELSHVSKPYTGAILYKDFLYQSDTVSTEEKLFNSLTLKVKDRTGKLIEISARGMEVLSNAVVLSDLIEEDEDEVVILTPEHSIRTAKAAPAPEEQEEELLQAGFTVSRVEKFKVGTEVFPLYSRAETKSEMRQVAIIKQNRIYYGEGESKLKAREDLLRSVTTQREGKRKIVLLRTSDEDTGPELKRQKLEDGLKGLHFVKGEKARLEELIIKNGFSLSKDRFRYQGWSYKQFGNSSDGNKNIAIIFNGQIILGSGKNIIQARQEVIHNMQNPSAENELEKEKTREPEDLHQKLMTLQGYERLSGDAFHFGGDRYSLWSIVEPDNHCLSVMVKGRLYYSNGSTRAKSTNNLVISILENKSFDVAEEYTRHLNGCSYHIKEMSKPKSDANTSGIMDETETVSGEQEPETAESKLRAMGFGLLPGATVDIEGAVYQMWSKPSGRVNKGKEIAIIIDDKIYTGKGVTLRACQISIYWKFLTRRVEESRGEEGQESNVEIVLRNLDRIRNQCEEKGAVQFLLKLGFKVSGHQVEVGGSRFIIWVPRREKENIVQMATIHSRVPLIVKHASWEGSLDKLKALIRLRIFVDPSLKGDPGQSIPCDKVNSSSVEPVGEYSDESLALEGLNPAPSRGGNPAPSSGGNTEPSIGGKPRVRYDGVGALLALLNGSKSVPTAQVQPDVVFFSLKNTIVLC